MESYHPISEADLPFVLEVRNSPSTRQYLHNNREFTIEESAKWFRVARPRWWIIKDAALPVGYVRTSNWNLADRTLSIGVDIHPDHRRKGFASRAYQHFAERLGERGWHRMDLEVLSLNHQAIRLYQQLGFEENGRGPLPSTDGRNYVSIGMSRVLQGSAFRAVKVVALYLGHRRNAPRNAMGALPMVEYLLKQEEKVDPGEACDCLIVLNQDKSPQSPQEREAVLKCEKLLSSAHGRITPRGEIRVWRRENFGLSFGAYNAAFEQFAHEYTAWFFTEDDHIMVADGYLSTARRQLTRNAEVGFVAIVGVSQERHYPAHCHGGIGISLRLVLHDVKRANPCPRHPHGHLPYHGAIGYDKQEQLGEIRFTNAIVRQGYRLENLEQDEVCTSWGQRTRRTSRMVPWNGPFVTPEM